MTDEKDALSGAKFDSGLYLKDFPVKIRVLTRDPMVYNDNFGNTKYVFAVFNLDEEKVQILDKTGGFPKRFQEINSDEDFGGDLRKVDLKITTNGKQGKEIRYNITPIGKPDDLTKKQVATIMEQGFDLSERVKKNNPGAVRLSEVNAGKKPGPATGDQSLEPNETTEDITIEDVTDDNGEIDVSKIPF